MKIIADDWHFRGIDNDTLLFDLFLENGQHALLEVNPMWSQQTVNGEIPELIVFCEMPGERLSLDPGSGRWITRPPHRNCSWSNVELHAALWQQIRGRVAELRIQHPPATTPPPVEFRAHAL